MRLPECFPGVTEPLPDVEIASVACDDREARPGTLFCCVPGFTRDGHDFAPAAVERGAAALLVERPLGLGVPEVVVADVRAAMAPAAALAYGEPTGSLEMVGITGTNGKTTTAYLTRSLLEAAGRRTGLVGTVEAITGGRREPAVRTTPESPDLQRGFREMVEAGDAACVMEVSSHALSLHRADAIAWDVVVFTNLSREHLDFHGDMDSYFAAKRMLFERDAPHSVVNVDDEWGRRLAAETSGAITVGIESGDASLRATRLEFGPSSTRFEAAGMELEVPLPGAFNVLNALCAVAAAQALGVDDATIERALPAAERAPGRFEPVEAGQPFTVIVDYAHSPDSLAGALEAARAVCDGRVIAVFGAGGDRDSGKRPEMGAAAAAGADLVVVTSDNPRSEAPGAIIADVVAGVPGDPAPQVIEDRREAIAWAVAHARPGDLVLIAGKGHEQGQEGPGGVKEPFDDRQVALEALGELIG
ncbi:MAG: UDP-N-acetylmuramoyl-L-alanyl-D-glutamate--2,6-diaminopimelate ligase [Solirubrobacterales bacterium]